MNAGLRPVINLYCCWIYCLYISLVALIVLIGIIEYSKTIQSNIILVGYKTKESLTHIYL